MMKKLSKAVALLLGLIKNSEAQQYIYTGIGFPDNTWAGNNRINAQSGMSFEECKPKCNNDNACRSIIY